jgi:hypothetical protein
MSKPAASERVTITLPADVVEDIDRVERNRSKFILDAVRQALERRRQESLQRSLSNPHPEAATLGEEGFAEWARALPEEDVSSMVDAGAGQDVRWVPGEGWVEGRR